MVFYNSGWSTSEIGTFSVAISGAVGSGTATVTPGDYAHVAISGQGISTYSEFAAAVQTALEAAVAASWAVSWDNSGLYLIEASGAFTLTWSGAGGAVLRRFLGFSGTVSSVGNAVTSDVRPYGALFSTISGRSKFTDLYEPEDVTEEASADDDTTFAIAKERGDFTSQIMWSDWQQNMEPKAAVLARAATSAVPWTWEHFFKHHRGTHPFSIVDGSTRTVHTLRSQGASFGQAVRQRVVADYDGLWAINLMTRDHGTF